MDSARVPSSSLLTLTVPRLSQKTAWRAPMALLVAEHSNRYTRSATILGVFNVVEFKLTILFISSHFDHAQRHLDSTYILLRIAATPQRSSGTW
ncbi:uncharacterized protein UTRI_01456 [Ustilago trichophora]|uniref:Uncharacterized protein n=1 Tax=Ustilago trichophora TaxID=86804 RepID=A0A5C3DX22_9BASI|nr:uncharacterized protein UTRI_01456 [Ustilago trichophora]